MVEQLETFSIQFDNPSAVYYNHTGNVITGHVLVILLESMKVHRIRLHLSGRGNVNWDEKKSSTIADDSGKPLKRIETVTHSDIENYLNLDQVLFGKQQGDLGEETLEPGPHKFSFSALLPEALPSSFEGTVGYIRYLCKAIIERPNDVDYTTNSAVTVLDLLDLNFHSEDQKPVNEEKSKLVRLGCCRKGKIKCTIGLPRQGYVPGEKIPIEVQIVNGGQTKLSEIKICLEEQVEYVAQLDIKHAVRIAAQVELGNVEMGQNQTWKKQMKIPSLASSMLTNHLMKIKYFLHLIVDPNGKHYDVSFKVPIAIGDIPPRSSYLELMKSFRAFETSNQKVPYGPRSRPENELPLSLSDKECPPAYYKESFFGPANIREEGDNQYVVGQTTFTPKYLFYDYSSLLND